MNNMEIKESPNTEIRNLREGTILSLLQILNTVKNDWERFMCLIPMDPQKENFEPKYNSEHVRLIEKHAEETNGDPVKILFDEWGTSGQIRPTLRTVQQIALKAEMMRLADEIADMLGEPRPPRLKQGPGAPVTEDISDLNLNDTSFEIRDTTKQMRSEANGTGVPNWDELLRSVNNLQSSERQESSQSDYQHSLPNISILQNTGNYSVTSRIDPSILQDTNLIHFDYNELEAITDNFSDAFKIGTGGFGDVFKAQTGDGMLAIKRTRTEWQQRPEDMMISFNNEVKYLSQFRHENIVPILGFSKGPVPCIVCEYIAGGSLLDKLAERVLSESQRLAVMRGAAEGLRYLHSNRAEPGLPGPPGGLSGPPGGLSGPPGGLSGSPGGLPGPPGALPDPSAQGVSKTNFVHGDVKSANILLTLDFVPKLCDFGLTKQYDYTFIQPIVIGTKVYMAPEALTGSVTPKSDIYSYGIVLLELLTALRPRFIVDGNEIDIKLYIDEGIRDGKTIFDFLDRSTEWRWAGEVFALATRCVQYDRRDRPDSEVICHIISVLQNN